MEAEGEAAAPEGPVRRAGDDHGARFTAPRPARDADLGPPPHLGVPRAEGAGSRGARGAGDGRDGGPPPVAVAEAVIARVDAPG